MKLKFSILSSMIYASAALECTDSEDKFKVYRPPTYNDDFVWRSCRHARKNPKGQCRKQVMKENCPLTCTGCCEDSEDTFEVIRPNVGDTATKSCRHANKNPWDQCAKPEMKANCPLACNACDNDVTCRLKADLQFPPTYSEGVHKDSLQVEKAGEEGQVCYSENQKTSWGCTHKGDAFFDATSGVRQSESARVFNAGGGQYTLRVSHDYLEADVLQNTTATTNSRANLIVKVNGQRLGTFRHSKNLQHETHEGFSILDVNNTNVGFINPEFNGGYSVQVNCNDACECDVERVEQTCRLQAQLAFPGFTGESENKYGYHADILKIYNKDNEECSVFNNVTSWCDAYGDAVLYRSESEYYDYNEAFAALIPDAADKTFRVQLEHYAGQREGEFGYYTTPAVLKVFANGSPVSAPYYPDGIEHGTVDVPCGDVSFAEVSCDGSCDCQLSPIVPICV